MSRLSDSDSFSADNLPTHQPDYLCIGHRGACGHVPENTLLSFETAVAMNCHWVELDVYLVESELIIIHDNNLERTTNGIGLVTDATLAYLRTLDAGQGQQIPTLLEVVEQINHRARINIELKGPRTAAAVNVLLDRLCQNGWHQSEFMISSFDHQQLALVNPKYKRGVLFGPQRQDYILAGQSLNAYSINLSLQQINKKLVRKAHASGFKVFVFTVNQPRTMLTLKQFGVNGIFTDYPDRFCG
ncbi:MAG: hypothetical protein KUG79_18345 [Pseudomonadales bacterium]|nr:hypothetical protein [Pseudomonadales bacterium]